MCCCNTLSTHRFDPDKPGKLRVDPEAKLEEELVVRLISEAIIGIPIRIGFSPHTFQSF